MVTDIRSSLDLWRAHFKAILNGDDTNNSANEKIRPSGQHFGQCYPSCTTRPSDREEVATAIQLLEFTKASGYDGLPAELFKAGGDELVSYMHHLLCNIRSLEACQVIGVLVCSAQYSKIR